MQYDKGKKNYFFALILTNRIGVGWPFFMFFLLQTKVIMLFRVYVCVCVGGCIHRSGGDLLACIAIPIYQVVHRLDSNVVIKDHIPLIFDQITSHLFNCIVSEIGTTLCLKMLHHL